VDDFNAFWTKTLAARDDFEASHERGCGLWTRSYQNASTTVRNLMKNFSPILEVVKDIAAPYGGLAVGTIAALFAVAASKNEIESALSDALIAINDRLPGLELYRHIYNEKHELDMRLQSRIVSAYELFIDFCIETTKYYKRSGSRRWLKAISGSTHIHDRAKEIQSVITEIRHLCDELLDKNVDYIKRQNQEQREIILRLEAEVQQLLDSDDNQALFKLQQLLGLSHYSTEDHRKSLEQYRLTLASDEHLTADFFEQMAGDRLKRFITSRDYQAWESAKSSSLLVVSAYNDSSISYLDQCWASPVALNKIAELEQESDSPPYGYYVFSSRDEGLHHAMAVILLQLLNKTPHLLRQKSRYDEIYAAMDSFNQYTAASDEAAQDRKTQASKLVALEKMASRIIGIFEPSESVYIIIDRVDRCCHVAKSVDQRMALMKLLGRLAQASRCTLKILTVVHADQWDVRTVIQELDTKDGRVIAHLAVQGSSI
jgi:hypothetical protein